MSLVAMGFPATAHRAGAGKLPFCFRRGAVRRGSNIKISEFLVKKRPLWLMFGLNVAEFAMCVDVSIHAPTGATQGVLVSELSVRPFSLF